MRIGYFVPVVSRLPGYERNVSGHIQIPLHALQLLADRNHDVHLITNEFDPDKRVLPWCMPPSASVHYVPDSRRRLGSLEKKHPKAMGVYPGAFLKQVRAIKSIVRQERFDVLHLHGHIRTVRFAGVLQRMGIGVPTPATLFDVPPGGAGLLDRFLMRSAGAIITATQYVAERCRGRGGDFRVVRHGLVRDFSSEMDDPVGARRKFRVLFWRDLTARNGADVALAAFDRLAPDFPHVSFELAVRPQRVEVPGVEEICGRHENVHLHRFPYQSGITLANLINESIAVVLPFRRYTIQPQLAIAETLAAGVPMVSSDIDSSSELISHQRNGLLVPPGDVEATTDAVRWMLEHRERAREMGRAAAADIRDGWTWDGYVEQIAAIYREACGLPTSEHELAP